MSINLQISREKNSFLSITLNRKKLLNKHETQASIPVASYNAFMKMPTPDTVLDLREKDSNYFVTLCFLLL